VAATKRPERERKSFEGRFNPGEIQKVCLVLNTADYCQTTAGQVRPPRLLSIVN
jgi:hypothetical protein